MKRNHLFSMFALVTVLGVAACGDRTQEEPVIVEEQPYQEPEQVQIDPRVTEGAIIMDTSAVGTVVDTTAR